MPFWTSLLFSLSLFLSVSPSLRWHSLLCWHKDERSCRQMWLWMSSCCSVTQLPLLSLSPWRQWLLSPQQMFLENKGRDRDCSFSPVSPHHPLLLMCRRTCMRWPLISSSFLAGVIFQSGEGRPFFRGSTYRRHIVKALFSQTRASLLEAHQDTDLLA